MSDRMTLRGLPDAGPHRLPAVSVLSAVTVFALLHTAALLYTGGVFEYPLDDVYIHLSMAEEIARGGYGINEGEYASAASSPLYPLLLTPFAGTEAQRYLPIFWNSLALILAAWLWGRVLELSGYALPDRPAWPGLALAALGPIAVNTYGLAFTGMEHALHLVASLAVLAGLLVYLAEGRIGWLIPAGIALATALRPEGLALGLLAAGVVTASGRWRAGLALGFLALLPMVLFSGLLLSIGLPPLPNSVVSKLALGVEEDQGLVIRVTATVLHNLGQFMGLVVLSLSALALLAAPLFGRGGRSDLRLLAYALAFAGFAHLGFGLVGWLNRYEVYVVALIVLGLLAILGLARSERSTGFTQMIFAAALAGLMAISGAFYAHDAVTRVAWTPRLVHLLQAQAARFAKDFAARPVAVNDIGYVAWRNSNYVLDLWGLASREAIEARLHGKDPRWAGSLAARKEITLAMVLDSWIGPHVGESWVKLGELVVVAAPDRIGDWSTSFYATSPSEVPSLVADLEDFARDLPEGAAFVFAGTEG